MKQNYKIYDKIKIIKTGIFLGLEGDVLSNTPEDRKPLCIILGAYGTWYFKYEDVLPVGKESTTEPIKKPIVDKLPFETEDSIDNLEFAPTKGKRQYHKKVKDEQIKAKRKYQKRSK